jgi:hypothetical protein
MESACPEDFFLLQYGGKNVCDGEPGKFAIDRLVRALIDAAEDLAHSHADGTGWSWRVAVDFGGLADGYGLAYQVQRDLFGGAREHPASSACGFGRDQACPAERGQEAADNYGVSANTDGKILRGEALAGGRCQQAEDVDGE